jgi:hypothetical protein
MGGAKWFEASRGDEDSTAGSHHEAFDGPAPQSPDPPMLHLRPVLECAP